jgi:hypothetical protein
MLVECKQEHDPSGKDAAERPAFPVLGRAGASRGHFIRNAAKIIFSFFRLVQPIREKSKE